MEVPLSVLFSQMAIRLKPDNVMNVHESAQLIFPDGNRRFVVTIRRGIAEVVEGDPLPGTPDPMAVLVTDAGTFRLMALNLLSPLTAFNEGKTEIRGSALGLFSS